ncbi:hypothetical protein BaRGS_00019203 [Batillaria attramentaria]|uniref:Uncharacterized protein n=1 Tax=Batillaria attramentaria TaxID=370345 RepID=A0ABD0KQX4_9CAEN
MSVTSTRAYNLLSKLFTAPDPVPLLQVIPATQNRCIVNSHCNTQCMTLWIMTNGQPYPAHRPVWSTHNRKVLTRSDRVKVSEDCRAIAQYLTSQFGQDWHERRIVSAILRAGD